MNARTGSLCGGERASRRLIDLLLALVLGDLVGVGLACDRGGCGSRSGCSGTR